MKKKLFFVALVAASLFMASCDKNDSEHVSQIAFGDLPLDSIGYWNGSDTTGSFTCLDATFSNTYNTTWNSWSGFSYSNHNNIDSAGYSNQYSVYTATPNTNGTFAICYVSGTPSMTFYTPVRPCSADFALSTIAYKCMQNGDGWAKKFEAGDWYKITITAHDRNENTRTLDVYLADFRNGKSLLTDNWTSIDLSSLGDTVSKLTFEASSSDMGQFGINTPAYFCIDNIVYAFKI